MKENILVRASLESSSPVVVIKRIVAEHEIAMALTLERSVFEACNFVSMDEYEKYLPQSTFFGAFGVDGCIGMVRLIGPGQHLPPFLGPTVQVVPERAAWEARASDGTLWEFATAAVDESGRNAPVFLNLVRAAYRFAHESGVKYFGAVMDPRRAVAQNRLYQLYYRQVGPLQHYMGEPELNAPYVMSFDEMDENTQSRNPEYLRWIMHGAETDLRVRPPQRISTSDVVVDLRDGVTA